MIFIKKVCFVFLFLGNLCLFGCSSNSNYKKFDYCQQLEGSSFNNCSLLVEVVLGGSITKGTLSKTNLINTSDLLSELEELEISKNGDSEIGKHLYGGSIQYFNFDNKSFPFYFNSNDVYFIKGEISDLFNGIFYKVKNFNIDINKYFECFESVIWIKDKVVLDDGEIDVTDKFNLLPFVITNINDELETVHIVKSKDTELYFYSNELFSFSYWPTIFRLVTPIEF